MKSKIILSILLALFLFPSFAIAIEPDPRDDYVGIDEYVDRKIDDNPGRFFRAIMWNKTGNGIYGYLSSNGTMSLHIINRSAWYAILTGGSWSAIQSYMYRTEPINFKFIIPYEDTFYLLVINNANSRIHLVGWYAKDTQEADITVAGLKDGGRYERTRYNSIIIDIADRSNIINVTLYANAYPIDQTIGNGTGFLHWETGIPAGYLPIGYWIITITVFDGGRNIGIWYANIIMDHISIITNTTTNNTTPIIPIDWIKVISENWMIISSIMIGGSLFGTIAVLKIGEARKMKRLRKRYGDDIPAWELRKEK